MLMRVLSIILLLACSTIAQSRLTVEVCCNADGLINADYIIKLKVTPPGGGAQQEIVLEVEALSESEGIALSLADYLNDTFDVTDFTPDETTHPDKQDPAEKATCEDVEIPDGYTVDEVSCERKANNGGGQLKVHEQGSTPGGTFAPATLTSFEFDLITFTGSPLELHLYLYEMDTATGIVVERYMVELTHDTDLSHPLQMLGAWFEEAFGATVTYPTSTKMAAQIDSTYGINHGIFMAAEKTEDDSPPTYEVRYAFTAQ